MLVFLYVNTQQVSAQQSEDRNARARARNNPAGESQYVDDENEPSTLEPNSKPLLPTGALPGFILVWSKLDRFSDTRMILEKWHSDPSVGAIVNITAYTFKSSREALTFAKETFYATTNVNQYRAIGKPVLGSLSGQHIGDVCWAYTTTMTSSPVFNSRTLLFMKHNHLVKVKAINRRDGVTIVFIEDVAQKIVRNLSPQHDD